LEALVRDLLADFGLTTSVFLAVAITAAFAFIFDAPLQLVGSMLVMGLFTAVAEYRMRSRQQPPEARPQGLEQARAGTRV
jgi:membrane protein implicated in regulation of membrane protease activity